MDLPQKGFSMAEYIWIDGHGGVRSKTKVRIFLTVTRPYHPTHSLNACTCLAPFLQPFALGRTRACAHGSALIGRADNKISSWRRPQRFIVRARSATSVIGLCSVC